VLDAVGGDGRLALVALVDAADVVCAVDVDAAPPAEEVPSEAGLEAAADRAIGVALVGDVVAEPNWRVPDGADARAADCAWPDVLAALPARWAVALGVPADAAAAAGLAAVEPADNELVLGLAAAGLAAEFAVAAEPVGIEPAGIVLALGLAAARPAAEFAVAAEPVGIEPASVVLALGLAVAGECAEAGAAAEFAVAAEAVAVEPAAGVGLAPGLAGEWADAVVMVDGVPPAVVLAADLLVAATPALVEARD